MIFHADELDQELGRENIEARLADPMLQQPFWNTPEAYNVDVYHIAPYLGAFAKGSTGGEDSFTMRRIMCESSAAGRRWVCADADAAGTGLRTGHVIRSYRPATPFLGELMNEPQVQEDQ